MRSATLTASGIAICSAQLIEKSSFALTGFSVGLHIDVEFLRVLSFVDLADAQVCFRLITSIDMSSFSAKRVKSMSP